MRRCSCALGKLGLECKLRQEFGGSPGGKAAVGSEGEGSKGDSEDAFCKHSSLSKREAETKPLSGGFGAYLFLSTFYLLECPLITK